jgi:hypothetical protein
MGAGRGHRPGTAAVIAEWVAALSVVALWLVLTAFYISWRASRLDRLHTRVETAGAALEAALARRHTVAVEMAGAPWLDPASRLLLGGAAAQARETRHVENRGAAELAESALSRTLRIVLAEANQDLSAPEAGEELAAAAAAGRRVHFARRFYNDAVAATREARSRRLVRTLGLAGSAALPEFFEMDDEPPPMPQP